MTCPIAIGEAAAVVPAIRTTASDSLRVNAVGDGGGRCQDQDDDGNEDGESHAADSELLASFHSVLLSVSAHHGDRRFIHECDAEHFAAIAFRQYGSIGKTVRFDHSAAFLAAETRIATSGPLDLVTGRHGLPNWRL